MSYERLVALQVKNPEMYKEYRAAMAPLLESYGGGFRYDFWIKETLKSESPSPINRVFAIYARDKEAMDAFFANEEYKKIKAKYFVDSVEAVTEIAAYSR